MAKITFVGAGSVVFAKTLICDILQNKALEASTLCLMDIDPARLRVADILARKVVEQLGVKAKVESTLDLKKACTGARYVITMIQVGGYKPATVTDFEIPKKYGLRQTIADTLGVGGVFRALRTMPELVKVGNALRDFGAPDPLYLNYSNPMAMNMMAIDRVCQIPSVGLCHSVQGTSHQLANYAGLPYEDISYKVAGINHVAFFLEFNYRGQDAYPILFKALENPRVFARDKVRFEMMRRLGFFVTESSEHFSEYCPWFIHHGEKTIEAFGIPLDEYLRRCESIIATWKDTEKRMLADSKVAIGKSLEYGSQIINAMESGTPAVVYGNVPNDNLITNLPDTCCVEVPCLVDKQGIQPTVIGDLPPQLAAICRSNIAVQELAVEAFLTGKREHIYHAVMMDPHTSSQLTLDNIWKMCDELIDAHQRDGFLPQFKPVRKNTGRSEAALQRVFVSVEETNSVQADARKVSLELVVENGTRIPFKGDIVLAVDGAAFRLKGPSRQHCQVAVGATKRIPLEVARLKEKEGAALEIGVFSDSPHVLARSFRQPLRTIVKVGSGRQAAALELVWSGNQVAQGTLARAKSGLLLQLRVHDTDILTHFGPFWEGSAIELFFASPGPARELPKHWVVLPDKKKPTIRDVHHEGEIVGTRVKVQADKSGYDFELLIPYRAAGLFQDNPFLFELQVRVNALGDAHGRVCQTWQGSPDAHLDTGHYALIQPV
ncbi:MAG: alpha-glucosidase/alpha-galactosidase [Candidatus Methylacidiphilales bacterium]|nr:alpha-glucosidase/alpha-galactosidase [Candidatus Methylacidiphilales bacterium]